MKGKKILKWSLRILLMLVLITGGVLIWIDSQLKASRGGGTEVIQTAGLATPYETLLIQDVQILAPDCSHFVPHQNVLLKDGLISAILPNSLVPQGVAIMDGKGQFLIPGLVDSHVHLRASKNDLYLYLANGVTGIREMSGNLEHLSWKKEIVEGALGPDMFVASEKINSKSGFAAIFENWTRARINYATEEAAASKVKELSEQGFDALKISSFLNYDMHQATLKYAQQYELPVVGHIPYDVGLDRFYASGQAEIAHIEELTKGVIWQYGGYGPDNAAEFLRHLRSQSDSIAAQVKQNDMPVSSTLALMESLPGQKVDLASEIKGLPIEYVNPIFIEGNYMVKGWLPGNNHYEEPEEVRTDPEMRQGSQIFWRTYVEALHIMIASLQKYKVPILAGTDANTPLMAPGFSLHAELVSLADAGLSNAEVLYSATAAAGDWMHANTGRIEAGYRADLLLLSQNPLEDIQNTQTIETVFSGQYWMDRQQLDAILAAVREVNDAARRVDLTAEVFSGPPDSYRERGTPISMGPMSRTPLPITSVKAKYFGMAQLRKHAPVYNSANCLLNQSPWMPLSEASSSCCSFGSAFFR